MIKHVLMIVTSVARIASTGAPTGIWLEELAAAYFRFRDTGWRVEIASIDGGPGPLSRSSRIPGRARTSCSMAQPPL